MYPLSLDCEYSFVIYHDTYLSLATVILRLIRGAFSITFNLSWARSTTVFFDARLNTVSIKRPFNDSVCLSWRENGSYPFQRYELWNVLDLSYFLYSFHRRLPLSRPSLVPSLVSAVSTTVFVFILLFISSSFLGHSPPPHRKGRQGRVSISVFSFSLSRHDVEMCVCTDLRS